MSAVDTNEPTLIPLPRRKRPVERLDSLKNPQPRPIPQTRKSPSACRNPECGATSSAIEEDGKTICSKCGSVISEMTMVSEVNYGLSGGAHVVHGVHVGADQAHAAGADVLDRHKGMSSREVTMANGEKHIKDVGQKLGIHTELRQAGLKIYSLCVQGFIQGRRTKSVAAVALYIACRTQRDTNTNMLIDFADQLQIDVFNLGRVYQDMLKHIRINGTGVIVAPINPEDLILRFCEKLEFGRETMKVAKDAVRIVQRMDRDWMTPGRRPAGICGAALILAARMNNFRRTVREVVYVVRVQEQTIFHRLDEFRITESSGLTVEEFRNIDLERLAEADPPIWSQQQKGKDGKVKKGRKRKHVEFDDDGDNDLPTVISSRATSTSPSITNDQLSTPALTQRKSQFDSRNMPPPPIPIDPNLCEMSETGSTSTRAATEPAASGQEYNSTPTAENPAATKATSEPPAKKSRGRPPKNVTRKSNDPILETDITLAMADPSSLEHASALTSALGPISNPSSPPLTQRRVPIPNTEEISDSEFCDDAEVNNCLLSPSEVAIKTRIWTHENRDYIRAQTAKAVKQQLAAEAGTVRVIVRRKRKRKTMGDVRDYLGEDAPEGTPVADTPVGAVEKMIENRKYSRKVNYDFLASYQPSSSGASSRRNSTSVIAQSPGSGYEMSGAAHATSRQETPARVPEPEAEAAGEENVVDEQEKVVEQRELNAIAGALDEEIEEYDDDNPYSDGGSYSD